MRRQTELFWSLCHFAIFAIFFITKIKRSSVSASNCRKPSNTTMDHIEAQLKKIRTKLDDVPAFQKAEVSVPFYLPRTIRSS